MTTASLQSLLAEAVASYRQGKTAEAEQAGRKVLAAEPGNIAALNLMAMLRQQQGRGQEALAFIDEALRVNPDLAPALNSRANILVAQKRWDEALDSYDRALAAQPGNLEALNNRAVVLRKLGRTQEALESLERLLKLSPGNAAAENHCSELLLELGRLEAALALYDAMLGRRPGDPLASLGRGKALKLLNRPGEAVRAYDQALMRKPDLVDAYFHRGVALDQLGHRDAAIASYDQAIALQPGAIGPINNRASTLLAANRFAEAATGFRRLEEVAPGNSLTLNGLASCAYSACDWTPMPAYLERMRREVESGNPDIQVGTLLNYHDDPALQFQCARNFADKRLPAPGPVLWRRPRFEAEKIRLAYCSADFRSHPVPRLLARMFENHDRSRFEVIAISFSVDDKSPMRARLEKSFDQFHDVLDFSDRQIAGLIADLKVDIAVDLMGYTNRGRPAIFAARPAPVQVNYMGYASSLAGPYWDYAIGDKVVLPMRLAPWYSEKIVQLPDTYMATDDARPLPGPAPGKAEAGLPQEGFVFCCFNNNWKITPPQFDIWMRLMQALPGSVLWLLQDNGEVVSNLKRHTAERGVAPERLVFAPRVPQDAHMARLRLADLFLDTLPYNAHTTAADSLWAGVPLVTCLGNSFYGRVAASLLSAMRLEELITDNLADYEKLALALARDPGRLASLGARIQAMRDTTPVFDNLRFTRNMERAYLAMRDIWRAGEEPHAFTLA